jgi:hypothetical protein
MMATPNRAAICAPFSVNSHSGICGITVGMSFSQVALEMSLTGRDPEMSFEKTMSKSAYAVM